MERSMMTIALGSSLAGIFIVAAVLTLFVWQHDLKYERLRAARLFRSGPQPTLN